MYIAVALLHFGLAGLSADGLRGWDLSCVGSIKAVLIRIIRPN